MNSYRQLESLIALYYMIKPKVSFPPMRDWAISCDLALFLYEKIVQNKPNLVVELGSGVSTVVIAYALKELQKGKLISIDHDESYLAQTKKVLERHELSRLVDLNLAPLSDVKVNNDVVKWYEIDKKVINDNIDILFIDGPPRTVFNQARYPALPFFMDHLSKNSLIILDDGTREDEKSIVDRWHKEDFIKNIKLIEHEKGTYTFNS
jgi:predicted O-methyltransferase YrrM